MFKENDPIRKVVNIQKWHEAGYTGKGIHVVVLDSKATANKHMPYASSPLIKEHVSGHGTNVAQCVHEFAPGVKITLIHTSKEGREWIKENAHTIDLINISMSADIVTAEHSFAFLADYDIPVVCATGNQSRDKLPYPAAYPWTIAVNAYNWSGKGVNANDVLSYGNSGKEIDCVAPTNIQVKNNKGEFFTFNGTSAATPVVTGMLACYAQYLKENGSKLTRDKAKQFIHNNCIDIREKGFDYKSGHGLFYMPEIPKITPPSKPVTPLPDKPITAPLPPVQLAGDKDKLSEKDVIEIMEQYFKDVGKSSALFNDIQKAVDRGITTGYSDGTFRPNDTVTRGQMMAFINRAIDYTLKEVKK